MIQQAVILAAGNGSRLVEASGGLPKGLIRVGPCSLLEHQLRALRMMGIERVCMVVGFRANDVRAAFADRCEFIENTRYSQTNSLYSLALVRDWVQGPFVLMNCDVLAHPYIIARVASARGSVLAFDSRSGHEEEHMKVSVCDGCVRSIGKTLGPDLCSGENVGVLRFDARTARALFDAAADVISGGNEKAWAPAAVDRIAGACDIRAIDVSDLPWCEIDFPHDLADATNRVWPAIRTASGWSHGTIDPPADGAPARTGEFTSVVAKAAGAVAAMGAAMGLAPNGRSPSTEGA